MQFPEFYQIFNQHQVVSFFEIKKRLPNFQKKQLSRWESKGLIKRIIRGFYIFSDLEIEERTLFGIANKIYSPSYISLEMALSFWGLIPEEVFLVTSASPRKTSRFETPVGNFSYRKIKKELMFGYKIIRDGNIPFRIAEPEKALLDFFYLNPNIQAKEDFFELRINQENFFEKINSEKLAKYLEKFNKKSLTKRTNNFLEFLKNDQS